MAANWTKEQEEVIFTRGHNILVSAAAGSGKTAVLVARILARICDPGDPVDIDELLIVTFTNAAALEMRERITRALEEERAKNPEDEHLIRQTALVNAALITTIDGFCSYVVRNYGHVIGVPPVFRVADKGETELMKQEALSEILEEAHAEQDEAFLRELSAFVETFATGKSERQMEEAVLRTARAADSSPDPDGWLSSCLEQARAEAEGRMFDAPWFAVFLEEAAELVRGGFHLAESNLEMTGLPNGPSAYRPTAQAEYDLFAALSAAFSKMEREPHPEEAAGDETEQMKRRMEHYDHIRALLTGYRPVKLSSKRPAPEEDPSLRPKFKARRKELGKIKDALLGQYFPTDAGTAARFGELSAGPLQTLIKLVQRFRERYAGKKQEKGVLDFPDLEHFALRILQSGDGRSYAAKELSGRFREVMIDEYQDSNYLQEAILLSVSRLEEGEQNYFCVGDVKQSIYSFRQARPDLFLDKFERFQRDPGEGVRIDLHRNFRSRKGVIDSVNGIFEQIMRREAGGVEYDEDAALILGADYPPAEGMESELLVLLKGETDPEGETGLENPSSLETREMEARMAGTRIRELLETHMIYDAKEGRMRKLRCRDIVILLRTMEGWADVFSRVLTGMRIPSYVASSSGYFSALEVTAVLNYLSVLDNPQQDIPFAAVLTSAFASLSAEDLARIRTADLARSWSGSSSRMDTSLFDAARAYAGYSGEREIDRSLQGRLQDFFLLYDSFRSQVPDTPLCGLISQILTKTGYLDYASALPGGAQRLVNLHMLIDKAAEYEQTSYAGLYHFNRYIENLKTYDQDFGELAAISEQEDVVRIYSIHKSKGLEYPVVFVSGLGKSFNLQDLNTEPLIHPELGVATNYLDYVRRTKAPTLHFQTIRRRLLSESIGEELRVLYVALTRAQQKLIMTGTYSTADKLEEFFLMIPDSDRALPVSYIEKCRSCFEWIYPAVRRLNERAERIGLPELIRTRSFTPAELVTGELLSGIRREDVLRELRELREDLLYDAPMRSAIEERFTYRYPHASTQLPVEVSVSELKEEAIRGLSGSLARAEEGSEDSGGLALFPPEEISPLVPEFYKRMHPEKEPLSAGAGGAASSKGGALRGTAYHRVMELLDLKAFAGLSGAEAEALLAEQVQELAASGSLSAEETALVKLQDIAGFLGCGLGQRMAAAAGRGDLYREQPFVLGMDASLIKEEWPAGETVFVQGIIDAFFYEEWEGEPGIVLVDYKTDRVRTAEELLLRYRVQLDSYAEALLRVTGVNVREKKIWSFALGCEVSCG